MEQNISILWIGQDFCRLIFDWDYKKGCVDISMSSYVIDALKRLQHNKQQAPQYSPATHIPIIYDKAGQRQYTTLHNTS